MTINKQRFQDIITSEGFVRIKKKINKKFNLPIPLLNNVNKKEILVAEKEFKAEAGIVAYMLFAYEIKLVRKKYKLSIDWVPFLYSYFLFEIEIDYPKNEKNK